MKNSKCFLLLVLLLLSSCDSQQQETTNTTASEIKNSVPTIIIIEEGTETSLPFSTAIQYPELIESIEDNQKLLDYQEIAIDTLCTITLPISEPLHIDFYRISGTFRNLVDEEKYKEWLDTFRQGYNYEIGEIYGYYGYGAYNGDGFKLDADTVDLNDCENLYTFSRYFNLSKEQIRNAIKENNKEETTLAQYDFTEKQIEALCNGTEEVVVKAFAYPDTIVKGDKFYSPFWFYYHSVEEYKQVGIVLEDLFKVYDVLLYYLVEEYDGFTFNYNPYVFDRILQNIYEFTGGDSSVNYKELCGYDRDFSMPFIRFYADEDGRMNLEMYERYRKFYVMSYNKEEQDKVIIITKSEKEYNPHWIYYNKTEAYKNAGITPTELNEMLPKYKELGVLTSEAFEALEAKIERYNKEYEKMD